MSGSSGSLTSANLLTAANALNIIRGSSKTLKLTVTDGDGKAVDLTDATVYFSVKNDARDERPLLQKSSKNSGEAEITTPREGIAQIYLQPKDTQNLDPHQYTFDCWVILKNGKRYPVVQPSPFVVLPGVSFIPL